MVTVEGKEKMRKEGRKGEKVSLSPLGGVLIHATLGSQQVLPYVGEDGATVWQ